MFSSTSPSLDVYRRERSSRRIIVTGRAASGSSTKKPTLLPSAEAIFIKLAIVGVMPFFSILCTAAVDSPARSASWASDQPRSARAFASLAPISDTVRSISGGAGTDFYDSARPERRQSGDFSIFLDSSGVSGEESRPRSDTRGRSGRGQERRRSRGKGSRHRALRG